MLKYLRFFNALNAELENLPAFVLTMVLSTVTCIILATMTMFDFRGHMIELFIYWIGANMTYFVFIGLFSHGLVAVVDWFNNTFKPTFKKVSATELKIDNSKKSKVVFQ